MQNLSWILSPVLLAAKPCLLLGLHICAQPVHFRFVTPGKGRGPCKNVDSMVFVWIIILLAVSAIFLLAGILNVAGDIPESEAKGECLKKIAGDADVVVGWG